MKTSVSEIAIVIGLIMIDCAAFLKHGVVSGLLVGGGLAILWGIGKAMREDLK